ncbi:hypothetical protein [Caballeronia sp. LZ032]|uniref:hypothetical protein n=1 Tax=Caballeronia sp. LZ032 TaxID=3038565 RepID=UPI002854EACC|nr:hypothetical protein [Caballeronia sp. LZ032]MDR5881876.1 hypothetical protein [Caballeronia sp. LZ032]
MREPPIENRQPCAFRQKRRGVRHLAPDVQFGVDCDDRRLFVEQVFDQRGGVALDGVIQRGNLCGRHGCQTFLRDCQTFVADLQIPENFQHFHSPLRFSRWRFS